MDKLQKPEQAESLIVLYNCKQSASALIHHLPYCSVKKKKKKEKEKRKKERKKEKKKGKRKKKNLFLSLSSF